MNFYKEIVMCNSLFKKPFKYCAYLSLLLSTFLISGCDWWSVPKEGIYRVEYAPAGEKKIPWTNRVQQLSQLKTFSLQGHLEVHAHGYKGSNVTFRWEQRGDDEYCFKLFDPLGRVYLELTDSKKGALLKTKGKVYFAKRAESLIQQHVGVNLPISYFKDWLRGLPTMGKRHERVLTPTYHLLKLHQADWFIRYLRYNQIRSMDLPSQLVMTKGDWYARILVTHWKI